MSQRERERVHDIQMCLRVRMDLRSVRSAGSSDLQIMSSCRLSHRHALSWPLMNLLAQGNNSDGEQVMNGNLCGNQFIFVAALHLRIQLHKECHIIHLIKDTEETCLCAKQANAC